MEENNLNSSATNLIYCLAGQVSVFTLIISIFADLIVIFVCFPVHECAHALVAKLCGDDTAEREGRVTLNPFAHIDWIGALMIFVCNIGYAKPTPVNLSRCRKVPIRTANVLVSIAGPLSNLLMAFILLIPYRILLVQAVNQMSDTMYLIAEMLYYAARINVGLAIFNLIPIPPFDGYHVLASFLPGKALYFMERNGRVIQIIVLVIIFSGLLSIPLSMAANGVMYLLELPLSFIIK